MSEFFSRSFATRTLSTKFDTLRNRGRLGLLAALGAPEAAESPILPKLEGEALAKHHLTLALEACRVAGTSKPHAFAKLRLLVNKLEQGHVLPPTTVKVPTAPEVNNAPTSRRRSRLLSRAFQGASHFAEWRKDTIDSLSEMR